MRVVFFTGSRSEFGLISPFFVSPDPRMDYRLIVGAGHTDPVFGRTESEISDLDDDQTVSLDAGRVRKDAPLAAGTGAAEILQATTQRLTELHPSWVVVYGDRYETFAFALSAFLLRIPIVHIEGGDLTHGGTYDDSLRHALTKIASLHLPTSNQAASVLEQLGEESWRIHRVGLPAHIEIDSGDYDDPQEVLEQLSLSFERPTVLVTWHPLPSNERESQEGFEALISVTKDLLDDAIQVIWTYPNYDPGSRSFIAKLEGIATNSPNLRLVSSLGRKRFRGLLSLGASQPFLFVGNSSAALKECPAFQCFSIDVGTRQSGRVRSQYTKTCAANSMDVLRAVHEGLSRGRRPDEHEVFEDPFRGEPADTVLTDLLLRGFSREQLLQKRHYG